MMFKTTLLKSSRRLLSTVLAAALVVGLLPTAALGANTSGTVSYSRANPEVPILNAYTGTSATLYKQLKSAPSYTHFGHYNAFGAVFGSVGTFETNTFHWAADRRGEYADSVMRELSKVYGNLEVNLSATFYNRQHTHTHAKKLSKYKYEITSYEKAYLQIGTDTPVILAGVYPDKESKYPRVGDYDGMTNANLATRGDETAADSYGVVRYNETDTTFKAQFLPMDIGYYHFGELKKCTCHGVYADEEVMTFRDARAPQLRSVWYSLDDGATWTSSASGLRVMYGKTLLIKLSYDEPIRFADDSAEGKGGLYLELQEDGTSTGYENRKAYLTKLDGKDLYFSYPFTKSDVNWNIQSLNTDALFGSDLPLKQLEGSRSFELDSSMQDGSDTTGFTTTTCHITDLAGNALAKQAVPAGNLILDSQKPYVKSVQFNLTLNNADVKEALNKTDPKDKDYTDASDLCLGVGDKVSLVLNMNERLNDRKLDSSAANPLSGWKAVATTNIKKPDNSYVTVESRYFTPEGERLSGSITSWVMAPITLEAGWTVDADPTDNPNGEIRVTALRFEGSGTEITDLAGNPLNKDATGSVTIDAGANANPPQLDVTAPEVEALADSYAPEADKGFRCGVRISDAKSGVADIYGSFILHNGGDHKTYSYQWAVTAEADTAVTAWEDGVVGVKQQFRQIEPTYIHIRPKAGETYGDLSGCTFTVKAKDYAGNESDVTLPGSGTLAWYIDNLAPSVKAGGTERKLNTTTGTGGTLTAEVILTDSKGVSAWQYAWSASAETAPATDDWTDGALTATDTADPVTVKAAAAVGHEALFSQYLWVKATDNSGSKNVSEPVCLGLYTYDLRKAQYELEYASGITAWAHMKVSSIGANDTLFFLVKEKNGTGSEYALLRVDSGKSGNIFDNAWTYNAWKCGYTLTGQDGRYTLTKTAESTQAQDTIDKARAGTYSGELTVVILSGPKAAVAGDADTAWTLGSETYLFGMDTVTLKTAGVRVDNYGEISITSDSELGGDPALSGTATLEKPYRSSLAGMKFTVSIAADKNGWDYADVNWAASYVELKRVESGATTSYPFKLQQGPVADDGSTTQTITIPEDDYETGVYSATLYLVCTAGQDYERRLTRDGTITGDTAFIVVDTVEPDSGFSLKEMTYAPQEGWPNKYGIADYYGTLDCLGEGGVITLPVAAGPTFGTGEPCLMYQFTIESDKQQTTAGGYGWYRMQIWNMADETRKLTIEPTDSTQQTVKNYISPFKMWGFVFDKQKADASPDKYLYLTPDQVNTVAMQKVYSNGRTSEVKYVQIKPVTRHITGTVSVDSSTHELVFTPADPSSAVGAKIYAWAWQNEQDPRSTGTRIDMSPTPDGTWRCSLAENGAMYEVITVNSAGSICDAGFIGARAPWFNELSGNLGDFGPDGIAFTDNGDGTYQLEFQVRDDYNTIQNGLKLDIGFNNDYAADHLSFTVKKGSNGWSSESTSSSVGRAYSWTETGVSSTGLYSVEVGKYTHDQSNIQSPGIVMDAMHELDYLYVTVKGCFRNVTDPQTRMNITVTATDALGYAASVSTGDRTVAYRQPVIYGENAADSSLKPKLGWDGLVLTFNQPVRPVDSWAWREADSADTSFRTQWEGAFPIAGKGTYELQFVDIFGRTCTQEVTITDAFTVGGKDCGMDLIFSTTDLTADTVAVTAACKNGYLTFWEGDGSGTIWKKDGVYDTFELLDKEGGTYWPASSIPRPGYPDQTVPESALKDFGTVLRSIRWYTNGKMYIRCGGSSYSEGNRKYGLTVYIGNIARSAPPADVRYYVYSLGEEFTQEGLERYIAENGGSVTVTGNVEVWYQTTRSVTPTEGGSQYLFTPENYQQGHTFAYADDAGNTASVAVTLPAGLTLAAPAVPPEDTTAPKVDIDIYIKCGGSYTRAESFRPGDADITQRFEGLGYVQGYSLTVNASDASGYEIAVSGAGAALSGNIVTITKAGTFTITVTDRSANKNAASVTFTVPAKLDNTPPEGSITVTANSLYDKTLTITLTDKDDAGQETVNGDAYTADADTVILSLPTGATRVGKNKYTYHITDNGEVEFVFFDLVGNRGTAGKTVTGIDTEPPALSVSWSPANPYSSEFPPNGPVNTNVTARIKSSKAMQSLTVQAENEQSAHDLLVGGAAQSYSISGPDNEPLVTFTVSPELVTVTYSGNYGQPLTFTATAPNGKSTTLTLNGLSGVIDKTAPTITQTQTPQVRTGYSVPYAVKVTLGSPDEWVTSPNYGATVEVKGVKQPVEYGYDETLVVTFTENGAYHVRFVDAAGNVTIEPVVITNIDRTAPELTVGTPSVSGQTASVPVTVNEACTLTWGENGTHTFDAAGSYTVTFTQNGTFAITATDHAGNESFKMVSVGSIDGVAPSISFTSSTIYVMEGSSAGDLAAALNTGYTVWDNVTASMPTVTHNGAAAVDLNAAGQYTVTYTVTDAAGNVTTANRFVRVIGSSTVCLNVDGKLILPDSTAVLRPGAHTLTLENNGDEPYSIKARKGILSAGQMKYLSGSSLRFDEHGSFSVTATGYYTLLVTTQSRQTIRILLYVEQ